MRGDPCLPPWSWIYAKTSDSAIRKGPRTSHHAVVVIWTIHPGSLTWEDLEMNTTMDEREKWDLRQNEDAPDLPKLASPCSISHIWKMSQVWNSGFMTGRNWFLKKKGLCILFGTMQASALGSSSFVSCETFSEKTQTRVLHAHPWGSLIQWDSSFLLSCPPHSV
jgi:hypothetical protein